MRQVRAHLAGCAAGAALLCGAWGAGTAGGAAPGTGAEAAAPAGGAAPVVAHAQNTRAVPRWDVFEITFTHGEACANPFFDVTIEVTFTAPSGRQATVGGFHYGCREPPEILRRDPPPGGRGRPRPEYRFAKADTWKARFAPGEVGRWTYAYTFTNARGARAEGRGEFACVAGRAPLRGFVRQDPASPMRWVFDDGSPYFPIGFQDGQFDGAAVGSCLAAAAMEGPFRLDRPAWWPAPPPGAAFKPGPAPNPQNADVQFRRFARCGFNLLRFSQQNFSYTITPALDRVNVMESLMTDELLRHARKYGLRVFYGLFGYMKVCNDSPDDAEGMAKVKRLVQYSVDRWGAMVDFWEFLNEQHAQDEWYAVLVPYLKSIDPYRHPVTTSWERPHLAGIDLSAPHQYVGPGDLGAARAMADSAARWKQAGKPVIVGEAGNTMPRRAPEKPGSPGVGGVWDPTSALRMRLRNWAGLFNEVSFIFWNTSYAKDGHFMNLWIGPREREYVRAMQDFACRLGAGVRMVPVGVSDRAAVEGWAVAGPRRAAVYLHHFKDHANDVRDLTVTLDVPAAATAYWYSPETAAILGRAPVAAGKQTLPVPVFRVDLALLITPDGPPDIDGDGLPNDADPDDDNDGVPDDRDAFPLEPEEWADADGDGIGDNLDADVDADGTGDDLNRNGRPDCEELDLDGDGVPRADAVPWDAFPLDPKEWRDTDGDGLGDNADPDDDGDGFSDQEEKAAGTDPLDRLSFPAP